VPVDRGGDVTYHGPGQLVAYPILDLKHWNPSVGWYLRALEQVVIDLVGEYGLVGERLEGFTGVWVGGAKVAAIGVGVHQWVTLHGLALNVNPDMRHWACIIPCGIADKPVISLAELLGSAPPMPEVMDRFEGHFRRVFE
jgi:lipoyl(octanoyl) transferase